VPVRVGETDVALLQHQAIQPLAAIRNVLIQRSSPFGTAAVRAEGREPAPCRQLQDNISRQSVTMSDSFLAAFWKEAEGL
jgi:hypothetical protein